MCLPAIFIINNLYVKKIYYICTRICNGKQEMNHFYFTYSFYYFYFNKE